MSFLSMLFRAAPTMINRIILPSLEHTTGHAIKPPLSSLVGQQTLLQPTTPSLVQVCGLKRKAALRRRCKDCKFHVRHGQLLVLCKTKPRHNQIAMKKKEEKTWILTHATQSVRRPW